MNERGHGRAPKSMLMGKGTHGGKKKKQEQSLFGGCASLTLHHSVFQCYKSCYNSSADDGCVISSLMCSLKVVEIYYKRGVRME